MQNNKIAIIGLGYVSLLLALALSEKFRTNGFDINKIEESISKKTKAIAIVHYLGIPVDMNKINNIYLLNQGMLSFRSLS
jgi:UDP-N-acetyl-D-mannosaminuronate dehydrogenase